jgi:hypothetical protein
VFKVNDEDTNNINDINVLFTQPLVFLILGDKRQGKTNAGWKVVEEQYRATPSKKIYVFNYPKYNLHLLKTIPFKVYNLTEPEQLDKIKDSIILIDEMNINFPPEQRKKNSLLAIAIQLSGQRKNTFVLIAHHAKNINKSIFDDVNVTMIKKYFNASKDRIEIANLVKTFTIENKNEVYISSQYYEGKKIFKKLDWFTDKLSNPFVDYEPLSEYKFNVDKKEISIKISK